MNTRPLTLLDRNSNVPDWEALADTKEDDADALAPRLCCRACGEPITEPDARIQMAGRHHHRCTNPLGHRFEIGCFAHAAGCRCLGPATREHTWFAGYGWRIALCSGCGNHLGWRYESVASEFYGLILDQLVERSANGLH